MAEKSSYKSQVDAKSLQLTRNVLSKLPPYVTDYINSRMLSSSAKTLQQQAYSLRRFFVWLHQSSPELSQQPLLDISTDTLAALTARDFEEYLMFLQSDTKNRNGRAGASQKLTAISSLLEYLYQHDDIPANPCGKVKKPKLVKDKRIIYLTDAECVRLLDTIEYGSPDVTPHQLVYLEQTRCRDLAITTLMLDTGIRLSECIGLNIEDVNLAERRIQVYRKGGKYQYLPINNEVIEILDAYIRDRKQMSVSDPQHKKALFLSMQGKRISEEVVANMLRKYALMAGITKNVTPHKLRKTYGTALYRKSRDIFMTANALGHENVETTSKHYVDDDAESLREYVDKMSIRS